MGSGAMRTDGQSTRRTTGTGDDMTRICPAVVTEAVLRAMDAGVSRAEVLDAIETLIEKREWDVACGEAETPGGPQKV